MRLNKAQITIAREMFEAIAYEAELDCHVRKVRKMLAGVGCKVHKYGHYVTLVSPLTGQHTLNMTPGVRPIGDLMIHAKGFAELQAGRGKAMNLYVNNEIVFPGDTIKDFRGQQWTFKCVSRVPEPGKGGKVVVFVRNGYEQEFYPSVFNGEIK